MGFSSRVLKSILDFTTAVIGLLVLSPLLLACGLAILMEDGCPIFFRQQRVGRYGEPFQLVKFRSMSRRNSGTRITAAKDPRITRVGAFLRAYKLDELPQLWNVLKGEMSLVGPRPELSDFVDLDSPQWRVALSVKPGITGIASLVYRNEEQLLAGSDDPERYYRSVILPAKLSLCTAFIQNAGVLLECKLIACTVYYALFPSRLDGPRMAARFTRAASSARASA